MVEQFAKKCKHHYYQKLKYESHFTLLKQTAKILNLAELYVVICIIWILSITSVPVPCTILPVQSDPKKKTMNNLDDRWRTEVRKQDSVLPKQKGLSSLTRIPLWRCKYNRSRDLRISSRRSLMSFHWASNMAPEALLWPMAMLGGMTRNKLNGSQLHFCRCRV